jgi:hypothetical protein
MSKIKQFLQQVFALKADIKTQKIKNLRKIKIYNFRRFLLNSVKKNATKSYCVLTKKLNVS